MPGLDPAIYVLRMDARIKPGHDAMSTSVLVPGAMQREAVHRRTGTVTRAVFLTAPAQRRTMNVLRRVRGMPRTHSKRLK